jgi:hypothetical protein
MCLAAAAPEHRVLARPARGLCAAVRWFCLVLFASAGCRVYDGGLLELGASADIAIVDAGSRYLLEGTLNSRDAGSVEADSQCWWCREQGGCSTAAAPDLAPISDDVPYAGASDIGPIYLAWTSLDLGADDATDLGFDLDGVCTNAQTCPTQRNVVSCATRGLEIPFDGAQCRDDSFAKLMQFIQRIPAFERDYGFSQRRLNAGLARGSFNVLLRISGYNGTDDDAQVRVDWYTSAGLAQPSPASDEGSEATSRLWRSSSSWLVDARDLIGEVGRSGELPPSRVADANAYVRAGYLVSRFGEDAALRLAADRDRRSFLLPLHASVLMGRLRWQQDDTWQLERGTLAGRAGSDEVMTALRTLGLCAGQRDRDQLYATLFDVVNESADLLLSGWSDPRAPCDGLSVGIGFEAVQVLPGAPLPLPAPLQCCPPGTPLEQCSADCGDARLGAGEHCDPGIPVDDPGACPTRCLAGACLGQWQGDGCSAQCAPPADDDDAGACATSQTN